MASVKLRTIFNRGIIGLAMMSLGGCIGPLTDDAMEDPVDISTLVPSGKVCVLPDEIRVPRNRIHHYTSKMYRAVAGDLEGNISTICFDWALDKRGLSGMYVVGVREADKNIILLNPASRVSNVKRMGNLRHELRHKEQEESIDKTLLNARNMMEWQRAALFLIEEADARTAEVAFAYRMNQKGHPEYLNSMRSDMPEKSMLKAYQQSLNLKPGDEPAAMRAAFLAFAEGNFVFTYYVKTIVAWIEENKIYVNPHKGIVDVLTDDILDRMGWLYGHNYMKNDEFKTILRTKFFTESDYKRHRDALKEKPAIVPSP